MAALEQTWRAPRKGHAARTRSLDKAGEGCQGTAVREQVRTVGTRVLATERLGG